LISTPFVIAVGIAALGSVAGPFAGMERWSRVEGLDPIVASKLRHAMDRASELLEEESCESLVDEFTDRHGRPLRDQLVRLGVSVTDYLELIVFREGAARGDAIAYTSPGSRVVFVHGPSVERAALNNPSHLVATVIHEMLHTLGLGENPPTSSDITARILARCSPGRAPKSSQVIGAEERI
jgi:hypothetical protein